MEVSFSLTYKEGNEIRVSLSSFPETAVSDLREHLGNIEIVEVSLVRQCGDDMADLATLSELVERIGKFLIENPNVILYYYCDEINAVPAMRSSRDIYQARNIATNCFQFYIKKVQDSSRSCL